MSPRKLGALAAVLVLTVPTVARGDEPTPDNQPELMPSPQLWLRSGDGVLRGPNGVDYLIPRDSRVLAPSEWTRIDSELLRLQEKETRIEAENRSLRASMSEWQPGWVLITTTLVVGLGTGVYLGLKL